MSYRRPKFHQQFNFQASQARTPKQGFIDILIDCFRALFGLRRREIDAPPALWPKVLPPAMPLQVLPISVAVPPPLPPVAGRLPAPAGPLPYRRANSLLTKGEHGVWYALYRAVKGRYRLFCKVRLADVVCCPHSHPQERHWFRKIGRYHVDFVICQPRTTEPLLVVELDDRGHRRRRNRERDAFKDAVLRDAGMPVLRIRAQQAYDPLELAEQVDRLIGGVRR